MEIYPDDSVMPIFLSEHDRISLPVKFCLQTRDIFNLLARVILAQELPSLLAKRGPKLFDTAKFYSNVM